MHRTLTGGRNRRMRAAITAQAAALAPAVTSELQHAALAAITAWCARPTRRTALMLAWALLDVAEQAARLDRMLDGAIRATVIMMREDR